MEIAALGLRIDGVQNADRAAASLDNLSRSGERAERTTGEMGNTSSRSSREVRSLADASRRASSDFTGLSRRALSVASSLGLVVSAAVAIRSSISTISSFEESMARVQAISRATADEMRSLEQTARNLGATTEFTAAQAADGLQFLSMAGFTATETIAAIPDVLNLATAASLDLGRAADIASNVMSGFGIAAENASRVTDVLAASSSRANTDVNQLGDAMSYVGPVASALAIDIGDTAAAIGVLSDAGIQGSSAGTGLRRVLSSLANPTTAAAKTLKELGVNLEDVNPQTNDLVDIINVLSRASIGAADALTIFGDRGGPALLALVENNPRLAELTEGLRNVEGEADRMAGTMRDNLSGDVKGMWSAIQELTLALNESSGLGGGLRNATQRATEFFRAMSTGVSDGSFSAIIDDVNETTRIVDFLEWRLQRFQGFLSGSGSLLAKVFEEGRLAAGIYGQNLDLIDEKIARVQKRLEGAHTASLRNQSNRQLLAELQELRTVEMAAQGDMEARIALNRSLSEELESISERMSELEGRRGFAARRELGRLAEQQEAILGTLDRINRGFTSQADAIEQLGGAVEGWRSPLQRVNDEITLMSESVERFRIVTAGSNDAVTSMVEELEAERRQLTMTSRELFEYNLITAMGEDANKTGARAIVDQTLALYDQTAALRKNKEVREDVLAQLDSYFDLESKNSTLDAQSASRFRSRLEEEVAAAQRSAGVSVAGVGMGDRQRQVFEEQARISEEFARRRTELTQNQLNEDRRMSDHHYNASLEALAEAEQARLNLASETSERLLEEQGSWTNGARRSLENYADSVRDIAGSIESAVTGAFQGMEDALVSFVSTGKADFKSLANSIIQDMIRIAIQQSITGPLASMFSFGGAAAVPVVANAKGGVYDSPSLSAYSGGVYNSPRMFAFAKGAGVFGEAGPEAIMPLSRGPGGVLGVRADVSSPNASPQSGDVNITVNVTESGANTRTEGKGESAAFGRQLSQAVRRTVQEEITKAQLQGGHLWQQR